jgi:peptide/nickel transport system ATP-binding protein
VSAVVPVRKAVEPVLRVEEICKSYSVRRTGRRELGSVRAVESVSLDLRPGQITALVGESGSGKSTLARMISGVEKPTSGRIVLHGHALRGRAPADAVQMMFQDPFASLNPVHTVAHHLTRPLALHRRDVPKVRRADAVLDLLHQVQLTPESEIARSRPHQLSGGQRQRVSIARALAVQPEAIVADEPVSMLDVSLRLGILNLLRDLVRTRDLALLYITHDIATARYVADTVLVMYSGRLVEGGATEAVTQNPAHPYTQLLLDSAPDPARRHRAAASRGASGRSAATRRPPPAVTVSSGCAFNPRCPHATEQCRTDAPPAFTIGVAAEPDHWAMCWLHAPEPAPPVRALVDQ